MSNTTFRQNLDITHVQSFHPPTHGTREAQVSHYTGLVDDHNPMINATRKMGV